MERVYNTEWGFGEALAEEDGKILVRFDADPWFPKWVTKEEE